MSLSSAAFAGLMSLALMSISAWYYTVAIVQGEVQALRANSARYPDIAALEVQQLKTNKRSIRIAYDRDAVPAWALADFASSIGMPATSVR